LRAEPPRCLRLFRLAEGVAIVGKAFARQQRMRCQQAGVKSLVFWLNVIQLCPVGWQ